MSCGKSAVDEVMMRLGVHWRNTAILQLIVAILAMMEKREPCLGVLFAHGPCRSRDTWSEGGRSNFAVTFRAPKK
jgi:hypothetical protein